jgi:hypothetical protein
VEHGRTGVKLDRRTRRWESGKVVEGKRRVTRLRVFFLEFFSFFKQMPSQSCVCVTSVQIKTLCVLEDHPACAPKTEPVMYPC